MTALRKIVILRSRQWRRLEGRTAALPRKPSHYPAPRSRFVLANGPERTYFQDPTGGPPERRSTEPVIGKRAFPADLRKIPCSEGNSVPAGQAAAAGFLRSRGRGRALSWWLGVYALLFGSALVSAAFRIRYHPIQEPPRSFHRAFSLSYEGTPNEGRRNPGAQWAIIAARSRPCRNASSMH